jgi:hypothetical protein
MQFEIARLIEGYLKDTPPTLISFSQLNGLQSGLASIVSEMTAFHSDKNVAHLSNTSSTIDTQVIPNMAAFVPRLRNITAGKSSELFEDLRSRSIEALKALAKDKDALEQSLAAMTTRVTEQDKRVGELGTAVDAQKKEAIAVTAEVKGEYAKTEKALREEFNTALREAESKHQQQLVNTGDQASEHLTELTKKLEEAKKIVQIIGNVGVTGNYQKIAIEESKSANFWRWATVGFFGVGVLLAVIAFFVHFVQGVSAEDFWTFAMRFVTAVVIASPAFYTARESARHRTNADRARQRELELASLGPFIELMEDEKKEAIREKLVDRYFGNSVERHEAKSLVDPKDVIELTKSAIDGLVKVGGKS